MKTLTGNAISCLDQLLSSHQVFDYIIPAVPFHLAYEYLLFKLKPFGASRGEIPPLAGLPNPAKGKTGDLYTSLADFVCPDDCLEPPRYCTVTRRKRGSPLYRRLMNLSGSFESRVIRSQQLGPGVGGFRLQELLALGEDLQGRRGSGRLILISTACRCHGVTSALRFKES